MSMIVTKVNVFDGTGAPPFPGEVAIVGERITAVSRGHGHLAPPGAAVTAAGATVIDGGGATLMPGLVDGHAHLTFPVARDRVPEGGVGGFYRHLPGVEAHTLVSVHNAKVVLEAGFTSVYSGGAATPGMEVALRDEIEAGWIDGPRIRAAGFEGQTRETSFTPRRTVSGESGAPARSSDPAGVRSYVRDTAGAGADVVKFVLSGPNSFGPNDREATYHDDELAAAQIQAAESGIFLSAHARPAGAIKQALRHGFRVIYHCDFIDEEGLDLLEERKSEVFVGPTVGTTAVRTERGTRPEGVSAADWAAMSDGLMDIYARNVAEFRRRGIRIIVGGDYGLDEVPHGDNAHDLVYLVKHCGLTPIEALVAGTATGGELMDLEVGKIVPGYLADLLLVDGDPTQDVSVLTEARNLLLIMKGGTVYRERGGKIAHARGQ